MYVKKCLVKVVVISILKMFELISMALRLYPPGMQKRKLATMFYSSFTVNKIGPYQNI